MTEKNPVCRSRNPTDCPTQPPQRGNATPADDRQTGHLGAGDHSRPHDPGPAASAHTGSSLTGQLSADLLIIGAGGAGLVAALSAIEAAPRPLRILLLEKAATPGGNTTQSAGMFAVDSPAQKRKGIVASKEDIFREKMTYAHWRIDPELTRDCLDLSGPLVAWLEAKGMRFESVIEFVREGKAPKVFHTFSPGPPGFIGKTIVERLSAECTAKDARILCQTAATRLLLGKGGIVGVSVRHVDERAETPLVAAGGLTLSPRGSPDSRSAPRPPGPCEALIAAKAVILATGGFGGNRALLEKYFPGHGDVFTLNRPEVTGDGLLLAEQVGAEIDDSTVLLLTGPHHYPWSHVLTLLVRRPEVVLVNTEGRRYSDETLFLDYHTEAGNALSRQPDKVCWALLDSAFKEHLVATGEIISGMEREAGGAGTWVKSLETELAAGVERGTVAKGATWEEVATAIKVDPRVLGSTIARYNVCCERGHDREFFKEARFLRPLRTPPFYAVLGRQGFDTTLGGIRVDRRMRVLDRAGTPISGLYAAGDCASGWEHENYNLRHPGSALTFAFCSGYIAGRAAAAYVTELGAAPDREPWVTRPPGSG